MAASEFQTEKGAEKAAPTMEQDATQKFIEEATGGKEKMELGLAFTITKHESITDEALSPLGLLSTARAEIKGGNRSQDLSPSTRNLPTHHFDNNMLKQSFEYTNQSQNKLIQMLGGQYTESKAPAILEEFGQRMHTLQDFYAHSNYVETQLKQNPNLLPQDLPLMTWSDIATSKSAKLHTGFTIPDETSQFLLKRNDVIDSLNKSSLRIPGTEFLPTSDYDKLQSFSGRLNYFTNQRYSVLHRDLNKDDNRSDEGKVVNPNTGYNLHQYARDLAVRETARQWQQLETIVRRTHSAEDARVMLQSLKTIQIYRPDSTGN
jgi:hypothetical protein